MIARDRTPSNHFLARLARSDLSVIARDRTPSNHFLARLASPERTAT
ncbi:hypothetical protein NAEX_02189 [Nannocystis exedens]|nr:hypothetical protein NAEX_02189 [Nannocystis exedens]